MCTITDVQQHRAGQIIYPLTLQTIIIAQMLSVGGEDLINNNNNMQ